jgi:glycosyltransferase involved in cell wall biosynthesis
MQNKIVHFHSTSYEETSQIMKYIGKRTDHIYEISNVPSIQHENQLSSIKQTGSCKCVYISRIHPKKNLIFALELLRSIEGKIIFDVYGPIEDRNYWSKCISNIKQLPSNVRVNYKGILDHEDVQKTFSQYHAFLFPTHSENYGHVIAESLLAGCPVITSDQVPWVDMNEANCGWSLPLNQSKAFIVALQTIVDFDSHTFDLLFKRCKKYVVQKIDFVSLEEKYIRMFYCVGNHIG